MAKGKKRKLTKLGKIIVILTIVLFLCLIVCSPYMFSSLNLIGKDITINYGDKYSEPGYKANFFFKDVSSKVKVDNGIKEDLGEYKVNYSYNVLFYGFKKSRVVKVEDLEKPKIELEGNAKDSVVINNEYKDPGYKVTDNHDTDLQDKVKVDSNVDKTKLGTYKIVYTVTDSSGNTGKAERVVDVVRPNPTTLSVKDFTLDGFFDEVKLKENTKIDKSTYLKKVVFVGDSNTKNTYENGHIKASQAWYKPCIHSASYFTTKLTVNGSSMLLLDATAKYKPEIMVISLGVFGTTWIDYDTFMSKSNELLTELKKASPNTKIVLLSLLPVFKGRNINNFTQDKINKYNYYILELASKYELKFLDVETTLKNDAGYGVTEYFQSDGFHLSNTGMKVFLEYVKTHQWEG